MIKYCPNCWSKVNDNQTFCPNCNNIIPPDFSDSNSPKENASILWTVLGFLVPLVGLILFLVWKNEKPKIAKKAGLGALIYVILYIMIIIIISLYIGIHYI